MFQPGLVLPLDSIDKRRKNENIQSAPPPPSSLYIPAEFGPNSETPAGGGGQAGPGPSSGETENSGRAVWLENWRKISQIDADNSGRETGAQHHSEKWRSELSSGPVRFGDEEDARARARARAKCRDKNCVNLLTNSASAKTSQSAKSELEGSEALPTRRAGRQVDPPENETRSENRNNNAKSSSGERKRLKVILNLLVKHFNIISENLSKKILFFPNKYRIFSLEGSQPQCFYTIY